MVRLLWEGSLIVSSLKSGNGLSPLQLQHLALSLTHSGFLIGGGYSSKRHAQRREGVK